MGRHSPHRRRSRSRSKERRRRKHEDDDYVEGPRSSSRVSLISHLFILQGIEEAKRRMRSGLESAISEERGARSSTEGLDDPTKRAKWERDIERIEDEGFKITSFKTTGGGSGHAKHDKRGKLERKEETHDTAIFGSAFGPQPKSSGEEPKRKEASGGHKTNIFHPIFFEDPEVRKQRWHAIFKERRRQVLGR